MLPQVCAQLGVRGPVALVTAGWRHDEPRDEPLREALSSEVRNLRLYAAFRVLEREAHELVAAYTLKQSMLRRVKERYRAALVPAIAACRELYTRRRDPGCVWFKQAIRNIQSVDALFLAEADRLHAEYHAAHPPLGNARVRVERARIEAALDGTDAVLLAGGHVGVLRNRLQFFGFEDLLPGRTIIAWSAGAMALTDRVYLFHDHTTYGVGLAEVLDRGLGLLPGVVFLPHARQRLDLGDPENIAILARRLGPAVAVGLQNGATLSGPRLTSTGAPDAALLLGADGSVRPLREVHAPDP